MTILPPDRAAVAPLPPALATPALAEAEHTRLGRELENYFAPLVAYCDAQPANDHLTEAEFRHGHDVRQALAAFVRYEEQTQRLLDQLRTALTYAQQQAQTQVPSLEAALGLLERSQALAPAAPAWPQNPDPTPAELLAEREADPLYRLGYVRGHRTGVADTSRRYEQVVRLYAQYAILVPPPGYEPHPLTQQVEALLASPGAQAYAALPLETRQAIDALTPAELQAQLTAHLPASPHEPRQAAA